MGNNELINKIKAGDDTIIKQIYLEHKTPFIKWIYKKFQLPQEDAIEIFQYAVVAMYDNIIQGKLEHLTGSIKTYLFSIGRNKAFELTRNNQRFIPHAELLIFQHVQHGDDNIQASMETDLEIIEQGLKILGEPGKSILQNFYYYRLTMEEIAQKMNYKNADTVKNLKYKSLKRLQTICTDIKKNIVL